MAEQVDIDININMNNVEDVDELTSKLQESTAEVERLENALSETEMNGDNIEADIIADELAEATSQAESLQSQLDEIGNTQLDIELQGDDAEDEVEEVDNKLQEASSSASSLGTVISGLAGMAGIDQMVSTADRINTSWNQLGLTFEGTNVSMDTLKTKTKQASDATGRSGSQVRTYFNNMGIAGITNTDLLSDSFQSMAGFAYQSGQSIESMESRVQKMVMTGNAGTRMLQGLGLTTQDLAKAMGVSAEEAKEAFENLTPEERLDAINTAMASGKEANDMYKNSLAGMKEQASIAFGGLMAAVGQGILPVVLPALQTLTSGIKTATNMFKGLPGSVQGAIGAVGGFLAISTTVVGALGLLGRAGKGVVDGLRSIKSGYDTARNAMGTARTVMDALRNSESITQGVRAALAIITGAETTAEGANAAAKAAATGPTLGLAAAENSLLWPILLVVAAVIAVIAVMWYLYNTNETVRNGINWLVAQIQGFINMLIPAAQGILTFVTGAVTNMGTLPGKIWNLLLRVVTFVGQWAANMLTRGLAAANSFVNSVGGAFGGIVGKITSALAGVVNAITKPFRDAWGYVKPYVDKIKEGLDFINPFSGFEGFEGYSGVDETLNGSLSNYANNSSNSLVVNNTFNGLVEESAADYIVGAVNDRLRREKLLKGA